MNVLNTLNQSFLKCVLWRISSTYINSLYKENASMSLANLKDVWLSKDKRVSLLQDFLSLH